MTDKLAAEVAELLGISPKATCRLRYVGNGAWKDEGMPHDLSSSCWHCAGLVVEEMRRRGFRLRLSDYGNEWGATLFFKTKGNQNDWAEGTGAEPPTAIFAAAKAALDSAKS